MLLPLLFYTLTLVAAAGNAFGQLGQEAAARYSRADRQAANVIAFHETIKWPGSTVILGEIEAGDFSSVPMLAPNVKGQIHPLGKFDGPAAMAEYYYGLSGPLPNGPPVPIRIGSIRTVGDVVCWANVCNGVFVYTLTTVETNFPVAQLTHHSTFYMDAEDRIAGFEVTFENLGRNALERTIPASLPEPLASQYANATTEGQRIDIVNSVVAFGICQTHEAICRPTGNAVYADLNECLATIGARPLGGWDTATERNNHCGYLHSRMVAANPAAHCSHIGPDDPMKCRPQPADYWYSSVDSYAAQADSLW